MVKVMTAEDPQGADSCPIGYGDELKEKSTQEQIEDKILNEILVEDDHGKRFQLIEQLDLLSRALITIRDRKSSDNF